ncbi:HAMP domain-containing sensor histidine kinase [Janthinobacterium sp.]|uniref:sensor histidine kinase n=1 Tax=Janthinobacterium sp. TaxID=1871054 RepID=UPI00293D9576|nr:HAMP domain-containing sensor histidine kinase [Janthinobacterium sp.]
MGRLFWKFFLSILLAQLAATVGIGGTFWLRDRAHHQQQALDIDTSPPAKMAIDAAAATLQFGGAGALRQLLGSMERHRVYAVDEDGREVLQRSVKPVMLVEARYVLGQPGARRVVRELDGADGHRYLLFLPSNEREGGWAPGEHNPFGRFGHEGREPPRGAPPGEAGFPFDPHYRTLIPVAAAILASLLFAFLLAWYFSRPIRALRLAFDAAAGGDLAPRFGGPGGGEFGNLGRDFDRMTGRLRALIDGQTRLLHDVSHELRSPLARLQAAIGLAHQQPDKAAASLERIERESVRMDKLVGELLTLARLEAGAPTRPGEEISMADLIADIVADARFEASSRDVAISVSGAADALLVGQADLLGRALENVLRNAIKHSPPGAVVELDMGLAGAALRLEVRDRGPGVAAADMETIFQPFFRGSDAQKNVDGHGLGLAIARHVMQAHGGSIQARKRGGGGLCVEMVLPLAPPAQA